MAQAQRFPEAPGQTLWRNDSQDTLRFTIRKGPDDFNQATKQLVKNTKEFTVAPGEHIYIDSEYDNAIRRTNEDGTQVIGGLAPQLTKVTDPDVPLHPSLDTHLQQKKAAEAEAILALEQKRAAEAALAQAGGKIVTAAKEAPPVAPQGDGDKSAKGGKGAS